MTDSPDGAALLEEARRTLLEALLPLLPPERRYDGLMVANAMAIAAREAEQGDVLLREGIKMLAALFAESGAAAGPTADLHTQLVELEGRLAGEIRAGMGDAPGARRDAVHEYLRWSARARVLLSNPKTVGSAANVAARIASRLIGRHLVEVERSEHDWLFRYADNVSLRVACPWRILVEGRIAHGDGDDGQQFGLPTPVDGKERSKSLLLDKAIQGVSIREDAGDLTVTFSDRTALEILNASSGYEGWQLSDGVGLSVVALGGGELALWNS